MRMKLNNPFLTAGYAGPDYFCDRVDETKKLVTAIKNDRNVTLIAPRRYGKTGLISNVFARLPSTYTSIYIDIGGIPVRKQAEGNFDSQGRAQGSRGQGHCVQD